MNDAPKFIKLTDRYTGKELWVNVNFITKVLKVITNTPPNEFYVVGISGEDSGFCCNAENSYELLEYFGVTERNDDGT